MKNLTFFLFALISSLMVNAQTQSDSIKEAYNKISDLENRITLQDTRIAKLLQQVDEVTKQNLALKKNLNLTPTVATAKAGTEKFGDIMDWKIIEVTGDPATKEVHLVIVADNITDSEKPIRVYTYQIIDDQGHGYANSLLEENVIMAIEGECKQMLSSLVKFQPNAPYTIDMYIKNYNPESQYIKHMGFDLANEARHFSIVFENLPIKWNN